MGDVVYDEHLIAADGDEEEKKDAKPVPTKLDVNDEQQEYAPANTQNPLAQFRFERPPKFPQVPPSHEHLMKPQNFELVASIGRGSFGQVFLVRRVDDNRFFAMKVLKKRAVIDRK